MPKEFNLIETDRIIEMAWEDRTPFEAIEFQFGINESEVIELMRRELKPSNFRLWRKRVNSGVSQKHLMKEIRKLIGLNVRDNGQLLIIKFRNVECHEYTNFFFAESKQF